MKIRTFLQKIFFLTRVMSVILALIITIMIGIWEILYINGKITNIFMLMLVLILLTGVMVGFEFLLTAVILEIENKPEHTLLRYWIIGTIILMLIVCVALTFLALGW